MKGKSGYPSTALICQWERNFVQKRVNEGVWIDRRLRSVWGVHCGYVVGDKRLERLPPRSSRSLTISRMGLHCEGRQECQWKDDLRRRAFDEALVLRHVAQGMEAEFVRQLGWLVRERAFDHHWERGRTWIDGQSICEPQTRKQSFSLPSHLGGGAAGSGRDEGQEPEHLTISVFADPQVVLGKRLSSFLFVAFRSQRWLACPEEVVQGVMELLQTSHSISGWWESVT